MGAWTKEGMEEVGEGQAGEWDEGGTKPDTKKEGHFWLSFGATCVDYI